MIDQPKGDKPALTVVVQSWWTPALAVIMLVVGLLVGYFGHPLVSKTAGATESPVAAVNNPLPAVSSPTASGVLPVGAVTSPESTVEATLPVIQGTSAATPTMDPTMAAITNSDQLMAYLVSKTVHFQGNPDAKVTLLEFSDYQ